ncbi:MAG: thymidine phosphorylase [Candidatus Scatovivens sp.]
MDIKTIIAKKRNKGELDKEEIRYFVGKYTKGEVTEAQAGALLSYIYINGLTEDEITYLALEMGNSGDKIDLSDISDKIVDKHSTGGVGDKVTLILMPIIAAFGLPVAKISSRGLGVSGGTIDKLEAIPGYDTEITLEEFKNNIKNVGVSLINQTLNIAPAEKKIYKLRNEIGCYDSVPIIAASLLSLKVATGSNKIVFDITCGKGTYIKSKEEAKRLSKLLIKIGKRLDKDVGCVITAMDEPLGYAVGNTLEIIETINSLKGQMPQDVGDVVVSLGSIILKLAGLGNDLNQNAANIINVIKSGKAYEKFKEMVANQYGSLQYIEDVEKFKKAKYIVPVYSSEDGFIEKIDADIVGSIAKYLGAGRANDKEEVDKTSGIVLCKKIGDAVKTGEILAYIHANDENKVLGATKNLVDAFKTTNKKVAIKSRIIEVCK